MSAPAPAKASAPEKPFAVRAKELATPYLAPYYLTIAAVLGALTTGFVVVILLLMIVVANVNVLGWTE
jgi:uncharacterized integral membrane protein